MAPRLGMIGVVVGDMARSLRFYRQLGIVIPEESDHLTHVQIEVADGLVFIWNSTFVPTDDPERIAPAGGYRVLIEFFFESEEAVAAKYDELIGLGYHGYRAPGLTAVGAYLAMVDDPDGNTLLLTAD